MLPVHPFGDWNQSLLVDETLSNKINLYLLEVGTKISAKKLMEFINNDAWREKHGINRKISQKTATRYLHTLGYRYQTPKKGQYADGHEREDVVYYREQVFLPQWRNIEHYMLTWDNDGLQEEGPRPLGHRTIAWFHDESVFYAHD